MECKYLRVGQILHLWMRAEAGVEAQQAVEGRCWDESAAIRNLACQGVLNLL
ncbi:hypothetical protein BLA15816_04219 [Burkholderia lata]|nr:hypothetical protein BLA15816_04219 [Burkholderia lata]